MSAPSRKESPPLCTRSPERGFEWNGRTVEGSPSVPAPDVGGGEDRELVRACIGGDPEAWRVIVGRYVRLVAHVVRTTLRQVRGRASEADVEDVTMQVYAHLVDDDFRVLRSLREPYPLRAWLAISARRRARDLVKRGGAPLLSLDETATEEGVPLRDQLAAGPEGASPETTDEVRTALERTSLTDRERLMVKLHYFRGRSYDEISGLLGIPRNSIGPTLDRAREKLRGTLIHLRGKDD